MPVTHPREHVVRGRYQVVKTLAIRLDDELHAQLSVLAQLSERRSPTRSGRPLRRISRPSALTLSCPREPRQCSEEIEHEAQARQAAITTLFGRSRAAEGGQGEQQAPAQWRGGSPRTAEPLFWAGHQGRVRG